MSEANLNIPHDAVSFVKTMDRFYSHRDTSPLPEANAGNEDFLAGYKVGLTVTDTGAAIRNEWYNRSEPDGDNLPFKEWKRGMWAARFTVLMAGNKTASNERKIH